MRTACLIHLILLNLIILNVIELLNVQFSPLSRYFALEIVRIEAKLNGKHLFLNNNNKHWTITYVQTKDEAYLLVNLLYLAGACDW
jgi:hypothetical protein